MGQKIAVIDYGMGNLRSVAKAIEHVAAGAEVRTTDDPGYIQAADRVVRVGGHHPGDDVGRGVDPDVGAAGGDRGCHQRDHGAEWTGRSLGEQ